MKVTEEMLFKFNSIMNDKSKDSRDAIHAVFALMPPIKLSATFDSMKIVEISIDGKPSSGHIQATAMYADDIKQAITAAGYTWSES